MEETFCRGSQDDFRIICAWERVLSLPVCSPRPFDDSPLSAGQILPHPERLSETAVQVKVFGMVFQRKRNANERTKGARPGFP